MKPDLIITGIDTVIPPFFKRYSEVVGQFRIKKEVFFCGRMDESQRFRMQRLTGDDGKTVGYELTISGECRSFQDRRTSVSLVIEQRMADVFHMNPDLVRAPGLEFTRDEGYVVESLDHLVMGDGMAPLFRIFTNTLNQPVPGISPDTGLDGSFVVSHIAPDQSQVAPVDGMFEKLSRQF
jgi:hypothetical protein